MYTSAWIDAIITIVLEVLHLLEDLLVESNIGLEVVLLLSAFIPEVV